MATYAIGDVQGCYTELRELLDALAFDPSRDTLWFVGDLVNRGPASLDVMRFVRGLGDRAVAVLGNHDLHLIAVALGTQKTRRDDTLDAVLAAPDRDDLVDWLRRLPLLHVAQGHALVHAGLLPQWNIDQAAQLAREVESALRGPQHRQFFENMYGSKPTRWEEDLVGWDRLRVIVNAMTRMRFCSASGEMEFASKGEATDAPRGYLPWFEVPGRASAATPVVCGHWSALGLRLAPGLLALDTGCVWGGQLTAVRLEDRKITQVPGHAKRTVFN